MPRVHTKNLSARLGAQHVGVCDVQVVARDRDIEIVFEGQRDRVIQRQIKLALVHQRVDPRGVGQIWRRHLARRVRANGIGKVRHRLAVVQRRNWLGFGSILRCRRGGRLLRPAGDGQRGE